jgi:major vault protein
MPRVEVKIVEHVSPRTIVSNTALKVRARRETNDSKGDHRDAGEEWLIRDLGFYIPGINEEIVDVIEGKIINDTTALLLEAK